MILMNIMIAVAGITEVGVTPALRRRRERAERQRSLIREQEASNLGSSVQPDELFEDSNHTINFMHLHIIIELLSSLLLINLYN